MTLRAAEPATALPGDGPGEPEPEPEPMCDIPSGCCSFTGPWTVTRSSLRMLRRVAAFCRPLRPVLPLVSFPRSRSPVVWCVGAVLNVAGCAVCSLAAPSSWCTPPPPPPHTPQLPPTAPTDRPSQPPALPGNTHAGPPTATSTSMGRTLRTRQRPGRPARMMTCELSHVCCWLRRRQQQISTCRPQEEEKSLSRAENGPRRLSQKVEKKIDTQKAPPPPLDSEEHGGLSREQRGKPLPRNKTVAGRENVGSMRQGSSTCPLPHSPHEPRPAQRPGATVPPRADADRRAR